MNILNDSTTQRLNDSTTQRLNDSTTQRLNDSTTQRLNDSTTQRLNDSLLTTSLALLSFFFLAFLLSCTGSTTNDPSSTPNTTDSNVAPFNITENYLGIHSVHFDITVNEITNKETFGFIIAPKTATAPTPTEVTNKDGYITRAFSPTQTNRSVFLFAHIATDMVKTFASNEFQTSASSDDLLSPGTDYTLYIYQQNTVVYTHNFTTATFATASTKTPTTEVGLNGGLISGDASPARLAIEYKTNEFLFFSFIYPSARSPSLYFEATNVGSMIQCSTSTQTCSSGYNDGKAFAKNLSSSIAFIGALQPPKAPNTIYGISRGLIRNNYNTKLITE